MARKFSFNSRTKHDFTPKKVFLDTTFIIDFSQPDSKDHKDSADFFEFSDKNDVCLYTSTGVFKDVSHFLQLSFLVKLAKLHDIAVNNSREPYWRKNAYRDLRKLGVDVYTEVFEKTYKTINQLNFLFEVIDLPSKDSNGAKKTDQSLVTFNCILEARKNGLPEELEDSDIESLMIMNHHLINTIVTKDTAFKSVDRLNVVELRRGDGDSENELYPPGQIFNISRR